MTDETDRMVRAERVANAMTVIAPYFDACRDSYLDGIAALAIKPMCDNVRAGIEKLAIGVKVLDEVRAQVASSIADGTVAEADTRRASNLASLSTEKRRWAQF